jgi:hypothetical protein
LDGGSFGISITPRDGTFQEEGLPVTVFLDFQSGTPMKVAYEVPASLLDIVRCVRVSRQF